MKHKPRAFLFDAYGTLFDLDSVMRGAAGIPANLEELSQLWRRKQIETTWLRALMERYEDFWQITGAALRSALDQLSIRATDEQFASLLRGYLFLDVFEDVRPALNALQGSPLAILSNGSPTMLESVVRHNQLESYFTHVISVDQVKTFKPSPRVYALGPEILKLPAGEILFISANSWDAAGAKAYGYQVCWCNRKDARAENLGFAPDFSVGGLGGLTQYRNL
jgi:2-haloacid dehalogenase